MSALSGCIRAYFDFVDDPGGAFRLVFESDLRNEPAVRERVERSLQRSVEAIADTIARDTGLQRSDAELLSCGLTGVAEISASWWLASADQIPKERAIELIQALAWRGISGYPRVSDPHARPARPISAGRAAFRHRRTWFHRRGAGRSTSLIHVEVRIGVKGAPRELSIESAQTADEIQAIVDAALKDDAATVTLLDEKGRRVIVATDKLAYVEIAEADSRRVGFGAL